ncbi:MAG TPA: hypothetical protein VH702_15545 [Vicinamibacterales bacterium]
MQPLHNRTRAAVRDACLGKQINDVYRRLKTGDIHGRAVIAPAA